MKIYLGADHRGFELKNEIKEILLEKSYDVSDEGAYVFDKDDDYTLFAQKVASLVSKEKNSRGILFCGSGVGVEVVANKIDGVRAGIGKENSQVIAGRRDDDMNILVIASDFTKKNDAINMIKAFLDTKFDGASRHKRRLDDIKKIEENN